MGRSRRKRDERGPLQRQLDREAANDANAPLVNEFAAQHGNYERNMRFVVNRGGTPVARWTKAGLLSESQQAGILHCMNLWGKLGSKSLVADFDRIAGQPHGDGMAQQEALDELHRIKGAFPLPYWNVFEGVCRFDEPAGVAGSKLTQAKNSESAARVIVCFIADLIAMRERLSF